MELPCDDSVSLYYILFVLMCNLPDLRNNYFFLEKKPTFLFSTLNETHLLHETHPLSQILRKLIEIDQENTARYDQESIFDWDLLLVNFLTKITLYFVDSTPFTQSFPLSHSKSNPHQLHRRFVLSHRSPTPILLSFNGSFPRFPFHIAGASAGHARSFSVQSRLHVLLSHSSLAHSSPVSLFRRGLRLSPFLSPRKKTIPASLLGPAALSHHVSPLRKGSKRVLPRESQHWRLQTHRPASMRLSGGLGVRLSALLQVQFRLRRPQPAASTRSPPGRFISFSRTTSFAVTSTPRGSTRSSTASAPISRAISPLCFATTGRSRSISAGKTSFLPLRATQRRSRGWISGSSASATRGAPSCCAFCSL